MNTFKLNQDRLDMVKFRDTDDFENRIGNYSNFILKFSASWCKPCKMLQEQIEACSNYLVQRGISVLHVDVDKCKVLTSQYKIGPIPTYFFFKSGVQVAMFEGLKPDLQSLLSRYYN